MRKYSTLSHILLLRSPHFDLTSLANVFVIDTEMYVFQIVNLVLVSRNSFSNENNNGNINKTSFIIYKKKLDQLNTSIFGPNS